jgi:membrane associated rhomboid family serine protease
LWFLAGFLESLHKTSWVMGLFVSSVLGTAAAALLIFAAAHAFHFAAKEFPLYGCFGGIFGLMVAMGLLYGDMEFLLLFTFGVKARHLAIVYALVSLAMLFGDMRMYAFAELGGGLAALLYIRLAPRRGLAFTFSEQFYGIRNRYYRWKRRRASRKFEVYMRSQGRTVHLDGKGRQIDDDHDDRKR